MVNDIYGITTKPGRLTWPTYRPGVNTMMRPLCKLCAVRPAAVAYHKYDRVYYRSRCGSCLARGKKIRPVLPRWQQSGYRKKTACDRCGFVGRHVSQLMVYHVNGNLNDSELRNLKTVCLNCAALITRQDLPWRRGDLEPDL